MLLKVLFGAMNRILFIIKNNVSLKSFKSSHLGAECLAGIQFTLFDVFELVVPF